MLLNQTFRKSAKSGSTKQNKQKFKKVIPISFT